MGKLNSKSLEELKEKHIGPKGSIERDQYELDLSMDVIGELIKNTRKKLKLTQAQLGSLVGVQKAQISKLESNAKNVTLATITKVFNAMGTKVKLSVDLSNTHFTIDEKLTS